MTVNKPQDCQNDWKRFDKKLMGSPTRTLVMLSKNNWPDRQNPRPGWPDQMTCSIKMLGQPNHQGARLVTRLTRLSKKFDMLSQQAACITTNLDVWQNKRQDWPRQIGRAVTRKWRDWPKALTRLSTPVKLLSTHNLNVVKNWLDWPMPKSCLTKPLTCLTPNHHVCQNKLTRHANNDDKTDKTRMHADTLLEMLSN